MLNSKAKLSKKIFTNNIDLIAIRQGFGEGLVVAGEKDERVVVLTADLRESTRVNLFAERFPERFIEVGVAEQALATIAAGMAAYGKIPFISSFAVFSPGRNWEQIRTAIALNDVPVKIVGSHAGVSVGADGATHQALEDIALMRVLPNMTVIVPADALEAKKATIEAVKTEHPVYLRLTRPETPIFTSEDTPFKIGRAEVVWNSMLNAKLPMLNVAIIACGPLVYEALLAAKELERSTIGSVVINSHTIKPLDEQTIVKFAKLAGAVVTVEEHQIAGGLGSAIAEVLSRNYPVPMEYVGMPDSFGESGKSKELLEKYKMKSKDIIEATKKVIKKKNNQSI